ncbi:type II secretion system minor pseudopilin GspI [Marinomonas ostreistagni]|uniref:Type II secretion system protein I n=1 Tax=Marinomonas ostreistagni TaxID=359209 RepID=A0ABS0ZAZ2_9GAMM|nr:type II secretion system minor pseudopilin GspI [Marinomonas ostreistagni]MBJ7550829.1 type II secretion system minor pseudopilin GspI [Marinomonas ostreistagni]
MVFGLSLKQGFTLIEVLVALVVLSAIGVMLLQTSETGTDHGSYLEQKLIASWVAENRASELRIAQRVGHPLELEEQRVKQGRAQFSSRVLQVKHTDLLNRLEIKVYTFLDDQELSQSPIYQHTLYLPNNAGE